MANNPTKTFYTRIQNKHDVASAWVDSTLVPLKGEIIVYDPEGEQTSPRFKIGDGVKTVPNLPFADDKVFDLIDDAIDQIGTSMANLKLGANGQKTTLSYGDTKISEVTVPYASTASTADIANKLGTANKGAANKGIYLNAGVPTEMSYELNKTVPSNAIFTDENVKNTLATTTKAYVTGTTSATTNTGGQVFDTGVYLDTTAGQLVATTFKGALKGQADSALEAGKVSKALTLKINGTNEKTYDGSSAVEFNVTASSLGLTNAMHFLGTSSTAITDGGAEKPTIGGSQKTPVAGDVVLYGHQEFVYTSNSVWELLGDEGSYALKTVSITAEDGLTGGGDLSTNRAIKHAVPDGATATSKGGAGKYISGVTTDKFGHITSFSEETVPTLSKGTATGSGNAVTDISVNGHTITVTKGQTFALKSELENLQSDLGDLKDKAVDSIFPGSANGTISYTIDGKNQGDVKVTGLKSAAFTESSAYAPASHTSVSATSSVLGHVKLTDSAANTDASKGIALSPKALHTYATGLNLSTLNENQSTTWVLFNCGTSDSVL